jgi:hypothetical protein
MDKMISSYIIDILRHEMGLADDQIWLKNENRLIPNDDRLYIIVGTTQPEVISVSTEFVPATIDSADILQQVQTVQVADTINVNMISRGQAAGLRNWEIMAACHSLYGQQVMEKNAFKIARKPKSVTDASDAEGGSNIYRYIIDFGTISQHQKIKNLSQSGENYYDDFTTRLDDANTIGQTNGVFEFEINSSGVINVH